MNYFKKWNLIAGWLAFAIAAIVYILTMEPTTSLWDCPEFIATSYKLQVGHPPGAPLFMMIARLFTMFAPSTDSVALTVNLMSSLCGAFTVLFLFWSITHLARKIYAKTREELTQSQTWTVIGAGLIGSLAYCFTDTQWFSAVEAEVYSMSSMFTALVVWAMLQWESVTDEPHSNRWLILIAYLMGLSIGIHILNLLAIPALVFIYYFRKYPQVRIWGVVKATLTAGALLVVMNYIIIPYTVSIGAWFDRIFVNGLGLPVNSGLLFFVMILFALCAFGIYITHKKGKALANIIVLCLTFILIGYSSYASVVIRAAADPPMNSNDPSNPYTLLSLLNREQYGNRPLLHGHYYTSVEGITGYDTRTLVTLGEDGRYYDTEVMAGYIFHPDVEYFFPRVYSFVEQRHIDGYKSWGNITGRPQYIEGHRIEGVPTTRENLRFFFNYQVNHMYWRYFLWNFAGRQNDIQGHGGLLHGNWLSGIPAIDRIHLGPQDNLPSELAANKARNTYFFLPFLLGLIGLIYQLGRDKKNFTVVMWLFVMMGLALVVYFNTTPAEVRERDYVFAGSFYAFCIWIGFGVLAVRDWIVKLSKRDNIAIAVGATVICSCVPIILAAQNWDDHDRSHRYVARDIGYNYLESTLPNSIIMNFGDNDTFPLWYNQEVENVRPDVRIMNTSYLGGEWYINQMKRKYNDSEPVPFSLPRNKYTNVNEMLAVRDMVSEPVSLRELMNFIKREDKASKEQTSSGFSDFIPTKSVYMTVNKANVLASGIVAEKDAHLIVDTIVLRFSKDRIDRTELMMLDLLDNFDWKRPLFFTQAFLAGFGLSEYLQFDGFAYRLVPIRTVDRTGGYNTGRVDTEYIYPRLMEMFRYGNVSDLRVYADEYTNYNFGSAQTRNGFARLAKGLLAEGDTLRAVAALDAAIEKMPFTQIRHNFVQTLPLIEGYYMAGEFAKGNAVLEDYARILGEYVVYLLQFQGDKAIIVRSDLEDKIRDLYYLHSLANRFGQEAQMDMIEEIPLMKEYLYEE